MAPLTPEEKKALALAKKELKKQQQIEEGRQLKRAYLERETKYGHLTLKRHETRWRQMLVDLALPKMREDLEFAWHNFERVIDCKNFTISLLMDEIRHAEEQYVLNVRNHVESIDKLMELLHERIEELQADFENEIDKLRKKGEEDVEELKLSAEEEEIYIKTMTHMLMIIKKRQQQNVRAENFSKLQENEKVAAKVVNALKSILDDTFHGMLNETVNFIHGYQHQTKERKKEHDELKTQDDSLQVLLISQLERIRKACEYIKLLKVKLTDSEKLLGRKLNDVEVQNEYFSETFSILKKRLEIDRKTDIQQLICLTVNYGETIEYLEVLRDKVESILNMSAVCRKLETELEKVKPFPTCIIIDKSAIEDVQVKQHFLPALELFWQRAGQADASRYAINEERQNLIRENHILKERIYEYCQCVTCPVPQKDILGTRIKHITDGAMEQKKYKKQQVPQFVSSDSHFDIDE